MARTRLPPTEEEDAVTRSKVRAPAAQKARQAGTQQEIQEINALINQGNEDEEADEEDEDLEEDDQDHSALQYLNESQQLSAPPLVGGGAHPVQPMYGKSAVSLGQASSPRLFAQAAKFPTCVQLRVWKMENGTPVGIGAIDSMAAEEDFVKEFYNSMPKPGEGRASFRLRPINMAGEEMGSEFTLVISENHARLLTLRAQKKQEEEQRLNGTTPLFAPGMSPADNTGFELSQMMQTIMQSADNRAAALESRLQEEQERVRQEDERRAQERINLATNAAAGVQAISEQMMNNESARAERAMRLQTEQSQLLLTTLTQIFASAQEQQRAITEAARVTDMQRLDQERQFAERMRMDQEERRKRDIAEMEERRKAEQLRMDDERKQAAAAREYELKQLEQQTILKKEEERVRLEREKEELKARTELERARLEREQRDAEARLQLRMAEEQKRAEQERALLLVQAEKMRVEWEQRYRMEQEAQARRDQAAREERDARQALEMQRRQLELEAQARRDQADREERDRRAAAERALEQARQADLERRAAIEAEMLKAREAERTRAHELALKQIEIAAGRDREYAERMLAMQKEELRAQKEAADARLAREREESAAREAERSRQHERLIKEAELQAAKDREHAERMMTLTTQQNQQKALGGLGELIPKARDLLKEFDIEPSDIFHRLFMPPEAPQAAGGNWSDAIPKVLETVAGVGKVLIDARAAQQQPLRPQLMPQAQLPQPQLSPQLQLPPGFELVPGMPGMMRPVLPPVPASGSAQSASPVPDPQPGPGAAETGAEEETTAVAPAGQAPTAAQEEEVESETASQQSTTQIALEAGLTVAMQKRVRVALRTLVRKLKGTREDKWSEVATVAISNEPGILHYVPAVSPRAALAEAGASEEMGEKIMAMLRENPAAAAFLNLE